MRLSRNLRIKLQKTALVVTGVVFGIMMTATPILWDNESTITSALGQQSSYTQEGDDKDYTAEELEYYKSDFKSIKEVVYNGFRLQEQEQKAFKPEPSRPPQKVGFHIGIPLF